MEDSSVVTVCNDTRAKQTEGAEEAQILMQRLSCELDLKSVSQKMESERKILSTE
jgi:hypothetical protein